MNIFSQNFKSEILVTEQQIQADDPIRHNMVAVKTDVALEDIPHVDKAVSTAVTSVGDQHQQSYANAVRSSYISTVAVISTGSRQGEISVGPPSRSTATVSGIKRNLSSNAVSGVSHSHKLAGSPVRAVKRVKFEHCPGQVNFTFDSMLKFLVENDRMETYLIQNNYEKNVLFHRGAGARHVYHNSLEVGKRHLLTRSLYALARMTL